MPATSNIGKALELIASQAAVGITWGTAPQARWYPDFEIDKLKPLGLTGFVLPETSDYEPISRAQSPTQLPSVVVHAPK
jgi:hypothetical protein